ncbi:JDVT-CTERM system glutamic-type intramembrane protease MrtJ [Undibacterium sp. TJN25]|uniref:JDVT-CTERM system glutamic-type intramembrane protease MrtJ n=1 Tax=Undibacterium sp. TJN25 TaxID=3413056 RepID=UPI003BF3E163
MNFIYLFLPLPSFCGDQLHHPDAGVLLRLLLLAPLLEEWIVRAGLQEWMIRRSLPAGMAVPAAVAGRGGMQMYAVHIVPVLVSALGFSLLHIASGLIAAEMVFLPGLALAGIYQATRDWRLCALVHCLFNAFALCFCGF